MASLLRTLQCFFHLENMAVSEPVHHIQSHPVRWCNGYMNRSCMLPGLYA